MRVECYYTIEGKAVYDNFKLVGWKPIGAWVLSGDTLLFKFLPGNEEAVRRAEQALIRADGYYGKIRGMKHLQYIPATTSGYTANHTIIKKTKKFASIDSCIDAMLEKVKKLAGRPADGADITGAVSFYPRIVN